MIHKFKRLLIGAPLPSEHLDHTRLPKFLALPVFASDALSSTAYATQEILIPLVLMGGLAAMGWSMPISIAIGLLLIIVSISYTQTIKAYPKGASCYLVSKDNLGTLISLIAGAGLLVGYILTVAVSCAAGVEQLVSAIPVLGRYSVSLNVLAVTILTLVNLRGAKESGAVFAIPTYLFVFLMYTLVGGGLYQYFSGSLQPLPTPTLPGLEVGDVAGPVSVILILRAFTHGCTALTGIEAVSDGVPAFQPPEAKNASITLGIMAAILASLFVGLSFIADQYGAVPGIVLNEHNEIVVKNSLISVLAAAIFGHSTLMYYFIQFSTVAILFLAANTAYADFPRLSSFLAADRFLPHQLTNIGDRLVYSNGIVVLGGLSALLLVAFQGNNHALLPLYAIGVFISFTLSQGSMVVNWLRDRRPGWSLGLALNGFGALCTSVVFLVLAYFRFAEGAWIVLIVIPALVVMFLTIKRHYMSVRRQLAIEQLPRALNHNTVLVLVPGLNVVVTHALQYARALSPNVRAVHIDTDPEATNHLKQMWDEVAPGIPLVILDSPYRSVIGPTLEYIEVAKADRSGDWLTVLIPEFVPRKLWQHVLHNQTGLILKLALMFREGIVVTNVRYWLRA
ncbi:MAG: APC family permease [Armatimonadetes bacterium]|nr:APC family permease [Armatimonadota bacterium]